MKMQLYIYLVYQLYILLTANGEVIPPSPCPEIFHYELVDRPTDSKYARVRGVITVQPDLSIFVTTKLQLPIFLNAPYNGGIRLKDKDTELMRKLQRGTLDKVVFYTEFQKNLPVPSIVQIVVNGRLLCSSPPIAGPTGYTNLEWFHSLKTNISNFSGENSVRKTTKAVPGYTFAPEEISNFPEIIQIPESPPKEKLPWEISGFENCGLEYSPTKLIVGGLNIGRGQGPWMVPLFKKVGNVLHFLCTSSLISKEHVLTAAHCVRNNDRIKTSDLVAYVGLYNISNWRNENSQRREIRKVHVHPGYAEEVDYDIAILTLSQEVKISRYVNPVCIWNQEEDLRLVEGREGTVFGWGMDGRGKSFVETPHISRMPIVSQETCRESNSNFIRFTSSRTLCAGTRNGSGPCKGDSGGGLLLSVDDYQYGKRWILRGITSSSLKSNNDSCDLTNYIIFTDVAKYKNWIMGLIAES